MNWIFWLKGLSFLWRFWTKSFIFFERNIWVSEIDQFNSWSIANQKQPSEVFYIKGVLRNFTKFTGKHLCQSLFFNKVAGLRHRCFPVNFVKFPRTPFFTEKLRRLLLTTGISDWKNSIVEGPHITLVRLLILFSPLLQVSSLAFQFCTNSIIIISFFG